MDEDNKEQTQPQQVLPKGMPPLPFAAKKSPGAPPPKFPPIPNQALADGKQQRQEDATAATTLTQTTGKVHGLKIVDALGSGVVDSQSMHIVEKQKQTGVGPSSNEGSNAHQLIDVGKKKYEDDKRVTTKATTAMTNQQQDGKKAEKDAVTTKISMT